MNEKIKELALEADIRRVRMANALVPSGFVYLHTEETLEKFAELLVRECAEVVNYCHSRYELVTPQQILRHFGVEE